MIVNYGTGRPPCASAPPGFLPQTRGWSIMKIMLIPTYPEFAPLEIDARDDLYPGLNLLPDGISEFTFAALYLFRRTYGYQVSRLSEGSLVISGRYREKTFFYLPCCFPSLEQFDELMQRFDYMRHFSESQARQHRIELEARGYLVREDRDSFDYLYDREALANLSGRAYHKKRNLVNGFVSTYSCEQRPFNRSRVPDALAVLDEWRATKGVDGDYAAARDALEHFDVLGLRGAVYYIGREPVGWCLGEPLAKGRMFAVHFEKACDRFKGIYQFVNQAFAQSLPKHYQHINREQDLGDLGLRQAKMTYRPVGFVKKYSVVHPDHANFMPAPPEPPAECGPGTIHECPGD
jgi:hypothetical protein